MYSVRDALSCLVSKEPLTDYVSSKTGQEVEASRQSTLEELPLILILHLKCFVYDKSGGCQKLLKHIEFSSDLDISKGSMRPIALMCLLLFVCRVVFSLCIDSKRLDYNYSKQVKVLLFRRSHWGFADKITLFYVRKQKVNRLDKCSNIDMFFFYRSFVSQPEEQI